ncbi:MAG: hypothetical protein AB1750_16135 [Chloroflexota bacterium]
MKILTIFISLMIAFAWLWGVYHLVITPLELAIFVVSLVVFAVLWFLVIRFEFANNDQAELWRNRIRSCVVVFQLAYLVLHILEIETYENLILITLATSFFGAFIYWGYRLVKDKVFD